MGRVLLSGGCLGMKAPVTGIPAGTLAVRATVKVPVNGAAREFIVIHQGRPAAMYDESCNGTWLLMKDIYETREWHSSKNNDYENCTIDNNLNTTFLNLFDADIQAAIKQVKIPYRKNGGSGGTDQAGANGLSCKVFLLSGYEVGWTTSASSSFPVDGAKLSYFEAGTGSSANNKRIAKLNGSATNWWLRSPITSVTGSVLNVTSGGDYNGSYATNYHGVRPALVLDSAALFDKNTLVLKGMA